LSVAPTEDPSLSRMTIVTIGSDDVIEQITKHLNRLVEVVKVFDLSEGWQHWLAYLMPACWLQAQSSNLNIAS